ncbi:MAG: aspartate aminotransferase family protein [Leptonema sp. (in: Bacteria)]|nr:aspartate aminotransferase family protein [Leptonema sp. (in: bacteria)]
MKLNQLGKSEKEILEELQELTKLDPDYKSSKLFSLVYYLNEDYSQLLNQAYHLYSATNGLNPGAFRSLKTIENRVIAMTSDLLNGNDETCGVITSGGTESCLLAVKTYRDYGREVKGIFEPEMVIADTAHVAWFKAAEYFNVKLHVVKSLPQGGANVAAMKRKINRDTIMILGSAPEYPHGIIDPIQELGKVAEKYKIPLHVDACVGGFLLPFVERLGVKVAPFDFRVKGVTSISADIHKYGFAGKGASTILYRSQKHFEYQVFTYTDWPGGIFASPALLGTRPGGSYASAYAALLANGEKGYLNLTRKALTATEKLKKGITDLGMSIIGNPIATLFAYRSTDPKIDIFVVADLMQEKGWYIDRIQKPDALHAMVTPNHLQVVDQYLKDLKESIEKAKAQPELSNKGQAATYGMMAHLPFRKIVKKEVTKMFASTYRVSADLLDLENANDSTDKLPPFIGRIVNWLVKRSRRKNI